MMRKKFVIALLLTLACVGLWFIPSPRLLAHDVGTGVRARVVSVDNSNVTKLELVDYGSQHLEVEILSGPHRGERFSANNDLRAQLALDKKFQLGDTVVVILPKDASPGQTSLIVRDHWRLGWTWALFGGFCVLLCAFGGWTGAKALFSFVFGCFVVWKGLIPLVLRGWPASWTAFGITCLLTAVIMYLVAGPTRKGAVAFFGSMLGVFAGLALAHLFGWAMHINGATMP